MGKRQRTALPPSPLSLAMNETVNKKANKFAREKENSGKKKTAKCFRCFSIERFLLYAVRLLLQLDVVVVVVVVASFKFAQFALR